MFKELRMAKYKMEEEHQNEVLSKGEYGIVSTVGADGYCYGVPVNYVFLNNAIYFHCRLNDGHKIDNINYHDKVSFTVVENAKIIAEKLDTRYDSVIVFGKATELKDEDRDEKIEVLKEIVYKYAPDFMKSGDACISNRVDKTNVVKISIDHICGKSSYLEGDTER
ncbi:MAG: pyridoxamine 5'-phosphate oxidase family protein [Clostridium sp.]|uniref:pyridoxamine 5'-phosphate oxidase family protein n=1 Tax=Clostridium sp. TaxID=1506 RepID=UPI00303EBAA0